MCASRYQVQKGRCELRYKRNQREHRAGARKRIITLPTERFRLEEINLPGELVDSLLGRTVAVQVIPEAPAGKYRFEGKQIPVDVPLCIDAQGRTWNDYWPMRVMYKDERNRTWRFPRYWLTAGNTYQDECRYEVTGPVTWTEQIHMPSEWDLGDINFDLDSAWEAHGKPTLIEVRAAPNSTVQVFWRNSTGRIYRIPSNWRRRRVKLPAAAVLMHNGVPSDIAEEFGDTMVSVNYHPGSLCCLPDGYRFRDAFGDRWQVAKADCILLGYGDKEEMLA